MQPELLVIVNGEDSIVRVWENTEAARAALAEWQKHDQDYCDGILSEAEYKTIEEYMDWRGIKRYTIESRWDVL